MQIPRWFHTYDDKPDIQVNRSFLKRVAAYARPYRLQVLLLVVLIALTAVLSLVSPLLIRGCPLQGIMATERANRDFPQISRSEAVKCCCRRCELTTKRRDNHAKPTTDVVLDCCHRVAARWDRGAACKRGLRSGIKGTSVGFSSLISTSSRDLSRVRRSRFLYLLSGYGRTESLKGCVLK